MPDVASAALLFLIRTLFDLYLFVLMIRIILVFVRANYFDPFTQFIVKLTNPIVKPLRRIIPNIGRIETASILIILILEIIKYILLVSLSLGIMPNLLGILIMAIGDTFNILFYTLFYAIILQVILSWVQPMSMLHRVLTQFTEPFTRPFQRMIPPINGVDISPVFVLIILQLLIILCVTPLMTLGMRIAIS